MARSEESLYWDISDLQASVAVPSTLSSNLTAFLVL
jgi:hypothetical protein